MGLLERTISESSDDIDIRPLDFGDIGRRLHENKDDKKLQLSSLIEEKHHVQFSQNEKSTMFFSAAMGQKRKKCVTLTSPKPSLVKMAWKNAAMKALSMEDPWEKFHLDECRTEKAKRHRFHALKKRWVVDEVVVKMEDTSFSRGAMRECFRMKKLSNFARHDDWSRAHNYVAKRYINEVPRETYFDDVKLQMDAKLWGEEYNRHNPPKKVDIFQMAILEMTERDGSPLFHVEHYIEGKYVKYNSNSGFVLSEALRMTPQAFSHFTFERSGHELIVVDIQGVGDLYTDPQIHTAVGSDYGDGNLGTRGMALFFHSHICNSICASLGLTQFDLAPSEYKASISLARAQRNCKTMIRGTEEHVILPTEEEREHIQECIRLRSLSSGYMSSEERERIDSISSIGSVDSVDSFDDLSPPIVLSSGADDSLMDSARRARRRRRTQSDSASDFGDNTETKAQEWKDFNDLVLRKARPSRLMSESEHLEMLGSLEERTEPEIEHYVLGQIHLDLAKYHELSRFVEEQESYDRDAAMFHLNRASRCGILDAMLAMAQIHMGLPHDVLPDIELDEEDRCADTAFNYLLKAARCGDRGAMINVAKAFDTGISLSPQKEVNWTEAVHWYQSAINTESSDSEGNFDGAMDDPVYQLVARQAEMYWQGGHNLEKDPNRAGELFTEAAELATEAMKGKLASKYYMKAEEAWSEVEE